MAMHDPRMQNLFDEEGPRGIGTYWIIVEKLSMLPDTRAQLKYLRSSTSKKLSITYIEKIIRNFQLFALEEDGSFSPEELNPAKKKEKKTAKNDRANTVADAKNDEKQPKTAEEKTENPNEKQANALNTSTDKETSREIFKENIKDIITSSAKEEETAANDVDINPPANYRDASAGSQASLTVCDDFGRPETPLRPIRPWQEVVDGLAVRTPWLEAACIHSGYGELLMRHIEAAVDCFKKQMSKFIDFSEDKALLVNNADWLLDLNYVDVLRDVGACFSVNNMLRAECYKQRMEKGLSFLEFNYMIMQSYDFYALYQKYGCNMQFGGDDQWSNMLGGTELIRRKLGKDAYAMTITLLLNSEGKKMGKTQKGAVWLDPNKTSPFEFYQYWRNVADADVLKCIRMLTFLPLEEIDKMDSWEGSQLNQAKEILAYELTKLVHGEEEAVKAQESARALFSKGVAADMPSVTLTADDFKDGAIDIVSVLVKSGLVTSRNEGRRAVEQGGVAVDGEKITDVQTTIPEEKFDGEGVVVRRGKKNFRKVSK